LGGIWDNCGVGTCKGILVFGNGLGNIWGAVGTCLRWEAVGNLNFGTFLGSPPVGSFMGAQFGTVLGNPGLGTFLGACLWELFGSYF
jgi:hypothetical protein